MLELRGLAKRLGDWSLADLDLRLEPGEYFVLLGPSGVGKTVTLELIAGLHDPDGGRILWSGRDVTDEPPEDRPFAIVYQDCALFPHLSVRDNIAYGPRVTGLHRAEQERRVRELAELLRIDDLLDRDVESLSGGEEQRVALARALATRPELLLLDEPLSALDAAIREYLRGELARLHGESEATFLHVTHAKEEARLLADRVGVMLEQRLVQVATPRELFHSPTDVQVSAFLGLRNVLPFTPDGPGRGATGGHPIVGEPLKPDHDHVWIRPEEITISREAANGAPNDLEGRVTQLRDDETLTVVQVACGDLTLDVMITHASFTELGLAPGDAVHVAFDDRALHTL